MTQKIHSIKVLAWTICLLGALFYCYEYLLRIAPGAMSAQLMQTFSIHAGSFGAIISLYYLVYTPMQAVVGIANDIYGPRKTLIVAVLICAIGSLLFSDAHSILVLSVARLLQGFGSAFAFVGALKLASTWLPLNRFAFFVGSITALGMLGGMFGNIAITVFVVHIGWREVYTIGAATGFLLMIMMLLIVKDAPATINPLNHINGKTNHQHSEHGYRQAFSGLALIIKSRQLWLIGLLGSLLYLSLSVFAELWGNVFIKHAYGFDMAHASIMNSMVFVGWLVGSPLIGWISDKIQRRRLPLIVGYFFALIITVLMLSLSHLSYFSAGLLLFLFGFFCSAENICYSLAREKVTSQLTGSAIAFINFIVMLIGLIFQPLVGKLLDLLWDGKIQNGLHIYSAHDFRIAMLILPISCLIGFVLAFFITEKQLF